MKRLFIRLVAETLRFMIEMFLRLRSFPTAVAARAQRLSLKTAQIRPLSPGAVLVFACYPKVPVEQSTVEVLKQFAAKGTQIVAVSTAAFPDSLRTQLGEFASAIIEMPNIGRDFGGYQQAVFYITRTLGLENVSRLIFLNDSIYFFSKANTATLVDAMLDDASAYVGCNENFNSHYHVGSYFFAIAGSVANSKAFRRFWQRYLPLSTRAHSISAGEVGITRAIISQGYVPKVLYQVGDIAEEVIDLVIRRDGSEDHLLSLPSRRHVLSDARRYADIAEVSHDDPTIGRAFASVTAAREADRLMEFLQNHNQVHNLALLFAKYAGMPFVKKDVVYRGMFLISDLVRFSVQENIDTAEAVTMMLRLRKTPATVIGIKDIWLSRLGFI